MQLKFDIILTALEKNALSADILNCVDEIRAMPLKDFVVFINSYLINENKEFKLINGAILFVDKSNPNDTVVDVESELPTHSKADGMGSCFVDSTNADISTGSTDNPCPE